MVWQQYHYTQKIAFMILLHKIINYLRKCNIKFPAIHFFINIAPNVNNLTFSHTINFRWQKSIIKLQADEGNKSYSFFHTLHVLQPGLQQFALLI